MRSSNDEAAHRMFVSPLAHTALSIFSNLPTIIDTMRERQSRELKQHDTMHTKRDTAVKVDSNDSSSRLLRI